MASSPGSVNPLRTSEFSPERIYPVSTRYLKTGSPRVTLRLGKKLEGNYIYQFKNRVTGEIYIGETRRLNGRVSCHISTANRWGKPSAKKTAQRLYQALKKNPEHFIFGILKVEGSPRKMEVKAVAYYKIKKEQELYNLNRGGGGPKGKEIESSSVAASSYEPQKAPSNKTLDQENAPPKSNKKVSGKIVKNLTDDFNKLNIQIPPV